MKKQTLGACQACLRDFVVHTDGNKVERMVLHGYSRPGTGYIQGKCPGTNVEPFEISCTFTKEWRNYLVTEKLPAFRLALVDLESGKAKNFTASHHDRRTGKSIKQFVTEGSTNNPAPWDKKEPDWAALRRTAIFRQKNLIEQVETDVVWLTERIRCWVYSPEKLRSGYAREPLTREGTMAAAERQRKQAELAQKKAAKSARAAAVRAKAEADIAQLVAEIRAALSQPKVKDTLLEIKGTWFGDINLGQLGDKYAHWVDLISRRGLLSVQTNLTWDLQDVYAAQPFDWMRNPEAIRRELRTVHGALKKELVHLGFKFKKAA